MASESPAYRRSRSVRTASLKGSLISAVETAVALSAVLASSALLSAIPCFAAHVDPQAIGRALTDADDARAFPVVTAGPDLDGIVRETEEELTRRPGDAELHFRLAFALEQRGDVERAIDEYRTVGQLAPSHVWARNNLGVLYARRGQYDEAIGKFGEALFRDPRHETARLNSGLVFLKIGETEAALRQFRTLLAFNPRHVEGLVGVGRVFLQGGDLPRAEHQFREALSIDPQSAIAQRFLAKALLKSGDAAGAVSVYREAAALRPDDLQVRYELAQALDADKKRSEAIMELRGLLTAKQYSDGDAVRRLAEATLRRWGTAP